MQTYCWINALGFRKAMKKYDKNMELRTTGEEMSEGMEQKLIKEPFVSGSLLDALVARANIHKSKEMGGQRRHEMRLIAGSANRDLAEEISGRLGVRLANATMKTFNDGEVS